MPTAYFLIPDPDGSNRACLAALVAGAVQPLAPLGFAFGRVATVSAEYAVGLLPARGGQSRLYRARLGPGGAVTRRRNMALPPHLTVHAVALHGPYLYVGGSWSPRAGGAGTGAAAGRVDLRVATPLWEPLLLPVPAELGKAIDDVLADAQGLVLVDNIVFPKYVFAYSWPAGEGLPTDPQVVELPFWRVYEHIKKGQLSPDYVALLSTSAGMGGVGTYVSVLRRHDGAPVVVLAHTQSREELWAEEAQVFAGEGPPPSRHPVDLALQGHTLVLACAEALLCVDLRAFPVPSVAPVAARGEPDYAGVDLGNAGMPKGVHWKPLPWHERPTGIRFVGPGQLLGTAESTSEQAGGLVWVKYLGE